MPPVGLEPTVSANERPQTDALDRRHRHLETNTEPKSVNRILSVGIFQHLMCNISLPVL
jgi:hypothetical protein